MSAQEYYGGTRQNTHTPGGSSSRGGQYLSAPLIDQAGYRPRSANSDRPRSGSAFSSSSSHHRSRSTGPAGSDAQFGEDGERGLLSTIGGGAAGGYAGKKFLGGKLGAVAAGATASITATTATTGLLLRRRLITTVDTTTATTATTAPRRTLDPRITARRTTEATTRPAGSVAWLGR
ncbi:hypothetical protein CSPAE12_05500 [Colletotrichum incanum]|nr:hypothetical protein CSPAE12_05500 [Colletotrichum incanum]